MFLTVAKLQGSPQYLIRAERDDDRISQYIR
jgi:hypothetical protein